MLEKILFAMVSVALFIIVFFKMIQKNDTNYIYVLAAQAIGIIFKFFSLLFNFELPLILSFICYMLSVILPIAIIIIEKKGINLSELICYLYIHINKDEEKNKKMIMKLIEKYPNNYYGHKVLAEIYEKEEKFDIAAEEYMRALEQNKNNNMLKYKIAFSLNNINKKDEAIKLLNDTLKESPEYYEASLLLVDILYEKENFREAINVCYEALKYRKDDYELYYNLGMLYTRLNDFQSAKDYYVKAAQINSLEFMPKYCLAQISLIYDDLDEAEQELLDCINNECEEDDSYYYLAYIQMLKGNKQKAIEYLNIAVEENEKCYEKAKKEILFRLIIGKIEKPGTNSIKKSKKKKLKEKEEKNKEYLENTYELVSNLNNNDIKAMKELGRKINKELENE